MDEYVGNYIDEMDIEHVFEQIMTDYGQDILHLTYSYVKNITIAEDLTQEIFVKCYLNLSKFNGESSIRTWLWRIAINHCKDYLKSWHVRNMQLSNEELVVQAEDEQVEQSVIEKDDADQVMRAILTLPLKYREPIYLFYYEELSIKEIESILHVRQNTIKTRLRRAKILLKKVLER